MVDYTHEIIRIERGATKGSGSPMYKCQTADGQFVNAFQHERPERNTFELLVQAGYAAFTQMQVGEVQRWTLNPIKVQLVKDGQWWTLAAVEPRPKFAEADAEFVPDVKLYQERAQRKARRLTNRSVDTLHFDFETTGVEKDDELVAASIVDNKGRVLFDELMLPNNPQKLLRPGKSGKCASEINGITPDMLSNCKLVEDALTELAMHLTGRIWVAYNAPFDVGVLERECLSHDHPLIWALGIHDAMQIFAEYLGDWQPKVQKFRVVTLGEAARMLDIDAGQTHTAKADALTTLEIMKAISKGYPIKSEFGVWA